jgi:leucyl/phenylalanyl-tRNA--protein transferase
MSKGLLDYREDASLLSPMIPPEILLEGYRQGIFPMALENGKIGWFSPDPRAIIPLDEFHIPHGLGRALARMSYEIKIDTTFDEVIRQCASRDETWIDEQIIESYTALHDLRCAHSVESWRDGKLVGGLYGVAIGGAFFGESMFHLETDASKVALYALVLRLRKNGFTLLDTQWLTPHLAQFGAMEISRPEYLERLRAAIDGRCRFAD